MANVEHKDLPNAQLHEPKGVSAASANTVYLANGAGSGTWSSPPYTYPITVRLTDVSTASSCYVAAPTAGTITKIYGVLENAITVADSAITTYIAATPITNGNMTAAYTGSAAGTSFSATPTAARTVSAGSVLRVETDGGSTTTGAMVFTFLITVP